MKITEFWDGSKKLSFMHHKVNELELYCKVKFEVMK